MAAKLKNLEVTKVDFVDEGANLAHISACLKGKTAEGSRKGTVPAKCRAAR